MKNEFNFNFNEKKVAIAKYGGPIAVCKDPSRFDIYLPSDPLRENVCFYQNNGILTT